MGKLLVSYLAPEDEWLAARRDGIGASEISAVFGVSPWQSPFSLYHSKREGWELTDTDHMEAGRRMEPVIADWFADRGDPLGNLSIQRAGLYQSEERPWQLATPDRLVYLRCPECDGIGDTAEYDFEACADCHGTGGTGEPLAVLECKHPFDWHGFGEEGTNQIPIYYLMQVLQQLDVVGVDEWFLAAYADHQFRIYRGRRDEADLRVMRIKGAEFWDRYQRGIEPDLDTHEATVDTLKRLHPSIEDVDVVVPVEFAEGYRRARALAAKADALVDRYQARARALLGNARRLMCNGKLVVSRSVYERDGEDYDLHALDEGRPIVDRLNPGRSATYLLPSRRA